MTETYEFNFCFPGVHDLENERVRLTPFIPALHAEAFVAAASPHPDLFKYLAYGPMSTLADLQHFIDTRVDNDPATVLFAVFDKTMPAERSLSGFIGLLNSSTVNLCTEIGHVVTLPHAQRTHVTTNAVGLLLHFCLDLPDKGGLGLRRVQWQAAAENTASRRTADRMDFRSEGIQRWQRVMPAGKVGLAPRQGDPRMEGKGRSTAVLSMCWDDWEVHGRREHVDKIMARTA